MTFEEQVREALAKTLYAKARLDVEQCNEAAGALALRVAVAIRSQQLQLQAIAAEEPRRFAIEQYDNAALAALRGQP